MLNKLTFFLLITLASISSSSSQTYFHKGFAPFLNNIEQEVLPNDDIIIAGEYSTSSNTELIIARFNSCGNVIWSKKISSKTHSLTAIDLKLDTNQNIVLGGNYIINGSRNAYLLSISPNGLLNYFKTFDTGTADIVYSMDISTNNDVYIYFKTNIGQAGPNNKNTLAKFKANGQLLWVKEYGFTYVWGQMCATDDGGVLISDSRAIVKVNSQGDVSWNKEFEQAYYSQNHFETPNGYIFFRYSTSSSNKSYAIMLNKNGSLKWNSQLIPNFRSNRGILRSNGNLLFIGDFALQAITNNVTFIEMDTANGNILKTSIKKEIHPLLVANDLNELSNNSIIYSGNEQLSTKGSSFISRINDTLSHISCKDSLLKLNYPRDIGKIEPTTPWIAKAANIPLKTPDIELTNFEITDELIYCNYSTPLVLNLDEDTTICPELPITLGSDTLAFDGYLWSNGKKTSTIEVNQEGVYILKAWLGCDTISDSIKVSFLPQTNIAIGVSPDTAKILDTVYFNVLSPKKFNSITWHFGDGVSSNQSTTFHQYRNKGSFKTTYSLVDTLGCEYTNARDVYILGLDYSIPNVFTPNTDGINDFFTVSGKGIINTNIQIYNRWGDVLYNAQNKPWDGSNNNGEQVTDGTYFYVIEFLQLGRSKEKIKGSVNLIR